MCVCLRERRRGVAQFKQHSVGGPPRQISNSTLQPAVLAPSEMLKPYPQLPDLPLAQQAIWEDPSRRLLDFQWRLGGPKAGAQLLEKCCLTARHP